MVKDFKPRVIDSKLKPKPYENIYLILKQNFISTKKELGDYVYKGVNVSILQ